MIELRVVSSITELQYNKTKKVQKPETAWYS